MNARLVAKKATQKRHEDMVIRVFELKFDKSYFNKAQKEFLSRLFLEAKWFYNYCIGHDAFLNSLALDCCKPLSSCIAHKYSSEAATVDHA